MFDYVLAVETTALLYGVSLSCKIKQIMENPAEALRQLYRLEAAPESGGAEQAKGPGFRLGDNLKSRAWHSEAMKKRMVTMDQILDGITQTDEWLDIQQNDPGIKLAGD